MRDDQIWKAHNELLRKLYAEKGLEHYSQPVHRSEYEKAMKEVQEKYGLRQGHPDFLGWVFTCVGHSPVIIEDEKGEKASGTEYCEDCD